MRQCVRCLAPTFSTCQDCGEALCLKCIGVEQSSICPMCRRVRAFKAERAAERRIVPWQSPENVSVFVPVSLQWRGSPGEWTEPMELVKR